MTTVSTSAGSVLGGIPLNPAYQPIIDLASGEILACEALVRGPGGSALAMPKALFAAARAAGKSSRLDWARAGGSRWMMSATVTSFAQV